MNSLVNRLKNCKTISNIVVCTTTSSLDDQLVHYLKQENIQVFRGNELDILQRFLSAANELKTDIIIDVEADKIYTDPKYIEQISQEMNNSDIDFMTGNNSLDTFDPEFIFHGFFPAGIKMKFHPRRTLSIFSIFFAPASAPSPVTTLGFAMPTALIRNS